MKILIDARLYGLENAGLGRYAICLIDELSKLDSNNQYTILLRKKYFKSLKLPENFKKVLVDFRHYSFREQTSLSKIIKSENPDLTHFLHFNVPLSFKSPFVVTIHDTLMHKFQGKKATTLNPAKYFIKRLAYKKVFSSAVKNSKQIIVPSKFAKQEVLKTYKINNNKISVIYEGIPEYPKKAISESRILKKYKLSKKYFIYTGNAYPHKNLSRAIEAICSIDADFAIVSSRNIFTKRLEEVIKKYNAQNKIKLLGFVPDDELQVLYKNSIAFLYPSFYEGFGLPGLEAMSAGTLSVVSDISIFKEIYKDTPAAYFNPHDYTSIQRALNDVLEISPSERSKIIKQNKNYIKKYSWQKMASETLKIYKNLL